MWRKGNLTTPLVGIKSCVVTVENSKEVSQNTKNTTALCPSNPAPGHISEKNKSTNLKRYVHPNIHSSIIYNC